MASSIIYSVFVLKLIDIASLYIYSNHAILTIQLISLCRHRTCTKASLLQVIAFFFALYAQENQIKRF